MSCYEKAASSKKDLSETHEWIEEVKKSDDDSHFVSASIEFGRLRQGGHKDEHRELYLSYTHADGKCYPDDDIIEDLLKIAEKVLLRQ